MNVIAPIRVQNSRAFLHPNSKITPKDVAPYAYVWSSEQLNEMLAIIAGLFDAQAIQDNTEVAEAPKSKRGRPRGSGYFEDKLINDCGPYRYLRYWNNGHRRSVYVGKLIEKTRNIAGAPHV